MTSARPDASYSHRLSEAAWTGRLTVARVDREVSRTCLEHVLDALERLAAMDSDAAAIEADHPGWTVRLCEHAGAWHWEASEKKHDGFRYPLGPPAVCGASAAELRAALAGF